MGKHETGYVDVRPDKDLFPTPAWVVDALAEHINISGKIIWEPAVGTGLMAEALKANGAKVLCSDIVDHGYEGLDGTFDFISGEEPRKLRPFHGIVTNPAYGYHNTLIKKWIEYGLKRLPPGAFLCLLLPSDYDAGSTRARWFGEHPWFITKIVLTRRIVWFTRADGEREQPKENHCWYVWQRPALRGQTSAILKPARFTVGLRYAQHMHRMI